MTTGVPARRQAPAPAQRRPPVYVKPIPIGPDGQPREGDWIGDVQIFTLGPDRDGRDRKSLTGPRAKVDRLVRKIRQAGVLYYCTDPVMDPYQPGHIEVVVTYFARQRQGATWTNERARLTGRQKTALAIVSPIPTAALALLIYLWFVVHPLVSLAALGLMIWSGTKLTKVYWHRVTHRTSNVPHVGIRTDHIDDGTH